LTYSWSFDDGGTATGASVQHTFSTLGAHTATLTVTDPLGLSAARTAQLTVVGAAGVASAGAARVSGSSAASELGCAGASGQTCEINLSLSVTETLERGRAVAVSAGAKARKRTVTVGTASATLAAGQGEKLAVELNSAGRALLERHRRLAAKLTATSGTSVLDSQTVTFKLAKKRR
ncbi:MAG TPA: PKD domain-containing protein, partial [Solirubrobacteraceae bacterium]|nr:PKD domain-containing protein [Solirubrobacteraceae bacterium]